MANDKSGRKKKNPIVTILAVIVILIGSAFGVWELGDFLPSDTTTPTTENGSPNTEQATKPEVLVDGALTVIMIDVGQADSFLLIQDGKTALIDCGTRYDGDEILAFLNSMNITKLDYVFGTHPHDDHMGGMQEVIQGIEVGKLIVPDVEKGKVTSNWYKSLEKAYVNFDVVRPKVGDVYKLGDATMTVLGPIDTTPNNINNYSTILMVSFGEMDILFTGDAETSLEKDLINSGVNLDAEILKIGHHGSDTSSSDAFLDAVSPEYGLLSTAIGNKHDHPIGEIMDKYEKRGIEIYRTDQSGTVTLIVTATDVEFSCEPGDYRDGIEMAKEEGK